MNNLIVPKKEFGKTGIKISKLCFGGGSLMDNNNQALLDEALKYGLDCWEIVSFAGNAFNEYFTKYPQNRDKVFLTGKVYSTDPMQMELQLNNLLKENGITYVDFLTIHHIENVKVLNNDIRKWSEKIKREKKIRFFGFCTHKNMENCLNDAADLGWIDGIQTVYNYRLQSIAGMEKAIEKCHNKGIGLFAIKSMGLGVLPKSELQKLSLNEEKVNSQLTNDNISFEQAKLKAIWQNPSISSICSLMLNSTTLRANASVASDKQPLSPENIKLLHNYANITEKYYCRRCGLCNTSNPNNIPIFDIMEMLMYSRSYGFKDWMRKKFAQIPQEIVSKIIKSDYSEAEKICPQKMPVGELMKEAIYEFSPDK